MMSSFYVTRIYLTHDTKPRRPIELIMEKHIVEPPPEIDGDNASFGPSGTCNDNKDKVKLTSDDKMTAVKADIKRTRVYDEEYHKKRSGVEAYMDGGEYEEFESVLVHVREDLKELKESLEEAIGNTRAYGKRDLKFGERVAKYDIITTLESVAQHINVALSLSRTAAKDAERVYNDVVHEAMDLQDSRTNVNDPRDAIFEVL